MAQDTDDKVSDMSPWKKDGEDAGRFMEDRKLGVGMG